MKYIPKEELPEDFQSRLYERRKKTSSHLIFLLSLGEDLQIHLDVSLKRNQVAQGTCKYILQFSSAAARWRSIGPPEFTLLHQGAARGSLLFVR